MDCTVLYEVKIYPVLYGKDMMKKHCGAAVAVFSIFCCAFLWPERPEWLWTLWHCDNKEIYHQPSSVWLSLKKQPLWSRQRCLQSQYTGRATGLLWIKSVNLLLPLGTLRCEAAIIHLLLGQLSKLFYKVVVPNLLFKPPTDTKQH